MNDFHAFSYINIFPKRNKGIPYLPTQKILGRFWKQDIYFFFGLRETYSVFIFKIMREKRRESISTLPNRPTPAIADKPCVACKQSLLRYKLSQLFSQYTMGHYVTERGLY